MSAHAQAVQPCDGVRPRARTELYATTILLGAFLLFLIQPMIARIILPWFGGGAGVWTACMLFFQVVLLAGYSYAHWLAAQTPSRQCWIHLSLLALSVLTLPVIPAPWWKPAGPEHPLLTILGLLATTVGLPYFALSSTSPLLQSWFARGRRGAMPYRYFALSNTGSMAGLIAYPILVEPNLGVHSQALGWSAAYALFALACAGVTLGSRALPLRPEDPGQDDTAVAPAGPTLLWLALAMCPSALMLALSSQLTQNVAPIPFLWILPLSLYLLSLIACFDSARWYRRIVFVPLGFVAFAGLAWIASQDEPLDELKLVIACSAAASFVLFMLCHGELARCKPPPSQLTRYYLIVAAGGALGGLLVGVAMPLLTNALYDLPFALALTAGVLLIPLWQELWSRGHAGRAGWVIAAIAALALSSAMARDSLMSNLGNARVLVRNFYGALKVYDDDTGSSMGPSRVLRHGTIDHGEQFVREPYRRIPTSYYSPTSGVGRAIRALQRRGSLHVGVVGLGTGTLFAYGRPHDRFTVYEINPLVPGLAASQFTYLADSPAEREIRLGDARLSLEREASQQFDLLVIDAFSGDSIPVHLLTAEAFGLYRRHLRADGVLAVHVSNVHLDLAPVAASSAAASGFAARLVSDEPDNPDETEQADSDWVLATTRTEFFSEPELATAEAISPLPGLRTWTDDYSNLVRILR